MWEIFKAGISVVDGFFEHDFEVGFEVKMVIREQKWQVGWEWKTYPCRVPGENKMKRKITPIYSTIQ